jgi:hypothetical protein
MNLLIFILGICLLSFAVLYRALRGRSIAVRTGEDLERLLQPVDLSAFRNLIDPEEDEFLRSELPESEYESLRSERSAAAMKYVDVLSSNAAILLWLGDQAASSLDPDLAIAGRELSNAALRVRMKALQAKAYLIISIAVPALNIRFNNLISDYGRIRERASAIRRLEEYLPSTASAAS